MKGGIIGLVLGASIIAILVLFFQRGDQKVVSVKNDKAMIDIQQGQTRSIQRMQKVRLDNAETEIDKAYYATQIDLEEKRIEDLEKRRKALDVKERIAVEQQENDNIDFREAVEIKGAIEVNKLDAEKEAFLKEF